MFRERLEPETAPFLVEPPLDPCPDRPELSAAVLTALEKDPQARPTTATALARMLHLASTHAPA